MNNPSLMIIVYSIALILLLFLSFFFSSSDMAYGSIDIVRFDREKENNKSKRFRWAYKLESNYDKTISTISSGDIFRQSKLVQVVRRFSQRHGFSGQLSFALTAITFSEIGINFLSSVGPKIAPVIPIIHCPSSCCGHFFRGSHAGHIS